MAREKLVLVVDDHYEMLDFLRSMLELANPAYKVSVAPSAEEGYLELRRTEFDLVITDVRLPGISGFEFVRKLRKFQPDVPVIMITAYVSEQGRREAEELGVYRYFNKPLDTDSLLMAVRNCTADVETPASGEPKILADWALPHELGGQVRRRLQSLGSDTGAAQTVLADESGRVLVRVGAQRDLDLAYTAQIVAKSLRGSNLLAAQLGGSDPFTIQYQSGERIDLYSASVGERYFIMLMFNAEVRRGRIGTVWIFAQRAIKELKRILAAGPVVNAVGRPAPDEVPTEEVDGREVALRAPSTTPESPGNRATDRRAPEVPRPTPDEDRVDGQQDAAHRVADRQSGGNRVADDKVDISAEKTAGHRTEDGSQKEAERPVDAPGEGTPSTEVGVPIELALEEDELVAMLGEADEKVDIDAFWEEALARSDDPVYGDALSFEEAVKRGLVPPEFDK